MKASIVIIALLFGSAASAQTKPEASIELATTTTPSLGRDPTARSIAVFDWGHFDLQTEVPFQYNGPPVEQPAAMADAFARSKHYANVTVVENCPMFPNGNGTFRHPRSLAERLSPRCIRIGYTPPPPTKFLEVKRKFKGKPSKKGRGSVKKRPKGKRK